MLFIYNKTSNSVQFIPSFPYHFYKAIIYLLLYVAVLLFLLIEWHFDSNITFHLLSFSSIAVPMVDQYFYANHSEHRFCCKQCGYVEVVGEIQYLICHRNCGSSIRVFSFSVFTFTRKQKISPNLFSDVSAKPCQHSTYLLN